ncbi:lytic transglycosylase domain-containing protein [Azospirillum soli]|uniref:lytic transglycosylase domain-containing protein n=1 Tax=Azospirillum soli TaxID=1304799 RepID=UPI001AE107FF|nr:lytic transglycosylase domain-containing protein [Azospirillum soli]MBP2311878.1 hypothetical protein [Azospirillum soli]
MIPTFSQFEPFINAASARFGVDPRLIRGVMALENHGADPALRGGSGEYGLMQVMPPTYAALAKRHGLGADASDPENNILAGTAYLSEQLKANGGDWAKTLAAYNAGPGGSAKFRATGDASTLPGVTRGYLQRAATFGLLDPSQAPPVEVAAPKPAQTMTTTSTQSMEAPKMAMQIPPAPESGNPIMGGLLGDGVAQGQALLALASGLLGGRNWGEGLSAGLQGMTQVASGAQQRAMQQRQLARQDRNDAADRDWRRLQFERLTRNDAADQQYRRDALRIQEMNASKETEPDIIKALRAAGIDPQSPDGQKYLRQKYLGGFGEEPGNAASDRSALAASLGVPLADADPFADPRLSAKGKENLKLAYTKAAEKRWAELGDQEAQARQRIADMERFKELNGKVGSGGVYSLPGAGAVAGALDSDVAEMRAITARIAPQMRAPGSGATSDFDAKQFERATVGIDKPKEANEAIANAGLAAAKLTLDRGAFERAYFDANGHLQGADRAWRRYLEANPIFDPKGKDFALNANRKDWRDFFHPKQQEPQSEGSAPASGGTVLRFDAQGNLIR